MTTTRKKWTEKEIEFLKNNYSRMTTRQLAAELGRTKAAVMNMLKKKGIRLPVDEKQRRFEESKFKSGNTPWNRGIKGLRWSPATEFKKGNVPPNTKFDGAVSIREKSKTKEKYLYIREAKRKWVLLHRKLWEQHYGPIPKGFVIRFKDGNPLNCVLENMELINRRENLKRNVKAPAGVTLSDSFIAGRTFGVTGRKYRPEKIKFIELNKDIIDLKRKQLLLQRSIK